MSPLSSTTRTPATQKYLTFDNEAEYESWSAKFHAQNMVGFLGQIIDLKTYTPPNPLEFKCGTLDFNGRLYPHPGGAGLDLYLLDFIDRNGTRLQVTNLYIYPYTCPAAESEPEPLETLGSELGCHGPFDTFYTLAPSFEYEIRDAHQQRLKCISFIYKNRKTLEPVIQD